MTMLVNGSLKFKAQVDKSLALWQSADPESATPLISSLVAVSEDVTPGIKDGEVTNDRREATIRHDVAFWPGANPELQVAILTSYISHAGIHALLRQCDSVEWNSKDVGEKAAVEYQLCLGKIIGVPEAYVLNPFSTIPQETSKPPWAAIALLAGGALVLARQRAR